MLTSISNSRIKHLISLRDKAKVRREEGLFIAEGIRIVREVPTEDLQELYYSEDFSDDRIGSRYEILSTDVFKKVSDVGTPQGVLAVVRQKKYSFTDLIKGKDTMLLILENIQDPGNMGTMFRTAEAAGCTGIIMTDDCVDVYSPKVVRATMGAVFRVPFIILEKDGMQHCLEKLKDSNVAVNAAALQGSVPYTEPDYNGGCAFIIGNEGNGLKEQTISAVEDKGGRAVRIPMAGKTESLNAAVSAAVLMYEAARQRNK
ncbi:MAG: RNA methyltransferase [Lachnospiraceae bacterium]|nr:RNA methyltransferase [Lachnospiraceae bacterium]